MTVVPLEALPLGFRFHPTDEELVNHYLKRKINGRIRSDAEVIPEIDVCKCEPWDLPDKSLIRSDDPEWFFFSAKDRKYPKGHRSNRATEAGYWKATGKDRFIRSKAPSGPGIIGMKKTLVFHQGRAPKGVRTHWIMHEYRATEPEFESGELGGYVLYRLFRKTEEKSSCSNGDEMERNGLSPAQTKPSPNDTTHEGDVLEKLGTPVRATPLTVSDLQEERPLSTTIGKQTAGITRWLADKGDRSSLKQKNSQCNSHMAMDVKSEDDTKGGTNVDPLLEALEQFCNPQNEPLDSTGFLNISSPMLPHSDHPFLGNNYQESYMGFGQAGYMEQDPMILNSILNNQDDCYSGRSNFKQTSTTEAMHSRSSIELDNEGPVQGAVGFETPGWCYADLSIYGFPEFDNGVQNSFMFPYDNLVPDAYSFDYGAESLHELFNSMDESTDHKNVSGNGADLPESGIEIRDPNQLPNVGHFERKQGNARRRLILPVTRYSISSTECESGTTDEENYAGSEADEEVGKDEDSSIENELGSVKEEKETKEVGDYEDYDHIATERDISGCMLPCKHKNISICDDAISLIKPDEVSHSEICEEAKPTALAEDSHSETSNQSESLPWLRTKSMNEIIRSERLKIAALKMKRQGPSVTVAYINRVMVVILLLICVGIWSWGRSQTSWIAGIYSNQKERCLECRG